MKPSPTPEEDAARLTRKRQRVLYSCTECHRRKQKCNRETPCENCISRRAPHLCIQYQPGYDSLDTEARISRLEVALDKGIQQVLDRLTALEGNGRQGAVGRSSRTQLNGVIDESMATPAAAAATTHSEAEPRDFDPLAMTLPFDSASEKYAALHAHLYPGARGDWTNRSRLLAPASRLLEELPEHDRCRRLLRLFFDNINELYMPLPANRLSSPLEALLRVGPVLKTDDLHLFSILASILTFAILTAPDDLLIDGPISRFEEARSLLDAAHLALLTADTLQAQDLDKVLAWLLLSRVFNIEDRTSDAYEAASRAVTSAYAINLHREPKMTILSADEEEERRRVWLMVYFQEKSLSIILGRPSTIQDDLCTTLCPDGDKRDSSERANSPSQFYCYHVLAKLMGRVNVVVQKSTDGQSHLHDALQIDSDICALRQMLPPYIRQSEVHVQNKLGNIVGDVSVLHHWAIASEIDALRIALHRQQPQQQQQLGDLQQRNAGMAGAGETMAMSQMASQNGMSHQSAQSGSSQMSPQQSLQQTPAQQLAGQAFMAGSMSAQEAAQKAHQLQAQLPRQMQQLQEMINAGSITQQQAKDRYMYLQNAAKMAMLQAQAQAAAQAAATSQQQQAQGSMQGQGQGQGQNQQQQQSYFGQGGNNQPGNAPMSSVETGQMGPPLQQQHQQQHQPQQVQPQSQTQAQTDNRKAAKRARKSTSGSAKAPSSDPARESQTASPMQASPSQLNMHSQQAMRMLQQGNLNQNLQLNAFATIQTAQLVSQGIHGVDVTAISHTMAQVYSQFLTQAQNAGQPMHIAAPLAFTAAQQEALKSHPAQGYQMQHPPHQFQQQLQQPSSQQKSSQAQLQHHQNYPAQIFPAASQLQQSSRPSSQAGPSSQTPATFQTPTKSSKYKVEYMPIRRDLRSHGGWDLDVVDRQLGDHLEGKGRYPRSVRELGHVDVESLIMSLRSRLDAEVTYSLNALFILTAGVQAPGFHLLLSLCEDLSDELLDLLEEAAYGTLLEDNCEERDDLGTTLVGIVPSVAPASHAEWVMDVLEEEEELKVWKRRRAKLAGRDGEEEHAEDTSENAHDSSDGDEDDICDKSPHSSYHKHNRTERELLRCSQIALSVLEIFRNLSTIDDNHAFLNGEPRFLRLLMHITRSVDCEQQWRRSRRGVDAKDTRLRSVKEPSKKTVFTPSEALRVRKDILSIVACLAGETCNLNRLDQDTVCAAFGLMASFIKDASDIEQEHGTVYSEVPATMMHPPGVGPLVQPIMRKVPQHADMALEAFSSIAQPDGNRQLLGRIIDSDQLVALGASLIKLLPVSEVDFQMLKTEARLGYCERIAMSLFNIAYLGSAAVKKRLKETVGVVGIIFRCIKRLIKVNAFNRNPFAVVTRRLIETLRMLDGGDNFNRPALIGFGMEGTSRGGDKVGQKRSTHGGLLVQDEMSVVELMTVEGVDPIIVAELEQLL